ncbi:hypothetical protein T484DRAFT_1902992 [Baffinella frigidus]|nr:hypothetical protein T484DRAFT_1902992 [Cryptophyta sp. CCMP2293]
MCIAKIDQERSKSTATLAPLASHDAKAAAASTAAMEDYPQEACSSNDLADLSAGEKRRRHSSEDVEDWEPGMGLDDDADFRPQERRARLAATSLLFERLVQQTAIIRAHVVEKNRQDRFERAISRGVATRHPMRPLAGASAPLRAKSISCELASPPSDEESAAAWAHAAACTRQSAALLESKVAEEWRGGRVLHC